MSQGRGRFITFEGGEGAGKTTQAKRLAAALEAAGVETLMTREPGGTFGAEAIRDLVLQGIDDRWSGMTELLLMYAARVDHVQKLIRPALDRGVWVISDRFADSTLAYQGYARGVPKARIMAVHDAVMDGFGPDLTLLFDIDPVLSLKRVETRGEELSRFDKEGLEFHKTIRAAFLDIAKGEPERFATIDAAGTRDRIHADIMAAIAKKFPQLSL